MVDSIAADPAVEEAPAPQVPALTKDQIEALIDQRAQAISDRRVSGLMSSYDKKIADMKAELRKAQKSFTGDDDDSPDPRYADLEAENRRLEQELELTALRHQYPDDIEDYLAFSGKETRAEQLAALHELRQRLTAPIAPVEVPAGEPEPVIPPVLPNQPARAPQGWAPGAEMTPAQADDYFKRLTVWPTHE